jgi:hypothetical protein
MSQSITALHQLAFAAATGHGVFTIDQAHQLGLTDRQLRRLESRGIIEYLSRRAGRFVATPATWRHRVAAACAALGPETVAGYRSAAALHHLDGWRREPEPIEVIVGRSARNRQVRSSLRLRPVDRTVVDGIPVTTVEWTMARLGRFAEADRVEEALDGAERDGRVARPSVTGTLAAVRGRGVSGVVALAGVLEQREEIGRTPRDVLARRMARVLVRAGLPAPELEYKVQRADGRIAFLDGAHPECFVGLEADGHASHASRLQRASDHRRQNLLELSDFHIQRFTYEQIHRETRYVVTTVAAALEKWGGMSFPHLHPFPVT